jgi:hypothetical protein
MKYENWIYGIATALIIAGAIMKIMHLPYASAILQIGLISTLFYQWWYVASLKKKIKELESKAIE